MARYGWDLARPIYRDARNFTESPKSMSLRGIYQRICPTLDILLQILSIKDGEPVTKQRKPRSHLSHLPRDNSNYSRRNFLQTAALTAGAAVVPESLWSQSQVASHSALTQIKRQFMITPREALDWATFKAEGGPTYAGGAGWKRY